MGLRDRRFRDEFSSLLMNLLRSSCCFRSKDAGRGEVPELDAAVWVGSRPPLPVLPHGQPSKHLKGGTESHNVGMGEGCGLQANTLFP